MFTETGYELPSIGSTLFVITNQQKPTANHRMRRLKDLCIVVGTVADLMVSEATERSRYADPFLSFGGHIIEMGGERVVPFTDGQFAKTVDEAEKLLAHFNEKGFDAPDSLSSLIDFGIRYKDGTYVPRRDLRVPKLRAAEPEPVKDTLKEDLFSFDTVGKVFGSKVYVVTWSARGPKAERELTVLEVVPHGASRRKPGPFYMEGCVVGTGKVVYFKPDQVAFTREEADELLVKIRDEGIDIDAPFIPTHFKKTFEVDSLAATPERSSKVQDWTSKNHVLQLLTVEHEVSQLSIHIRADDEKERWRKPVLRIESPGMSAPGADRKTAPLADVQLAFEDIVSLRDALIEAVELLSAYKMLDKMKDM